MRARHAGGVPSKKKTKQKRRSIAPGLMLVALAVLIACGWALLKSGKLKRVVAAGSTTNAPAPAGAILTNETTSGPTNILLAPEALRAWVRQETNAADLVNTGSAMLGATRFQDAIFCFRRAVELKDDDEDAAFNLAYAYSRVGAVDLAIGYYQKAIEIFPEYADAHNNLGNMLLQQGRFGEAIEHFNAAIKSSPEHSLAHNGLGRALAQQGKPREALPHFQEATRLDPANMEAQFNLGSAFAALGRTNDAVAQFQEVLKHNPNFGPAQQALARLQRPKATNVQ